MGNGRIQQSTSDNGNEDARSDPAKSSRTPNNCRKGNITLATYNSMKPGMHDLPRHEKICASRKNICAPTIPLNLLRSAWRRSPHQPGARNFQLLATSFHGEDIRTISCFASISGSPFSARARLWVNCANLWGSRMNMRDPTRSQKSRFSTLSAFCWMNSRRGSTTSPISLVNKSSASATSSTFTLRSVRASGSNVVSHN